jgi:GNAT superfamily N-acetyltransferase
MMTVIPAEGAMLDCILAGQYAIWNGGLSLAAFRHLDAARRKTAWAQRHAQWFALVNGTEVLASAKRYRFAAVLDQRPAHVCGLSAVFTDPRHRGRGHARALVHWLLDDAGQDGADLALLFSDMDSTWWGRNGFKRIPTVDVELGVAQSPRHGAPMTLIRGGAERDLAAIVAMGQLRAAPFRFHLDRDIDLVQYAIMNKRLLAGLGAAGARQLQFFIAEEGITAAAYVVLSVVGRTWTIEECGDRDPSGARVGAILQALIAREPVERRPLIGGWLPLGFVPPQVTIVSARPSAVAMMVRTLGSTALEPPLAGRDVLYWRSDLF